MIGLIIILVAGLYFAVWGLVVYFSYRLTFRASQSKKKSYAVASFFFVVMYMIPFWDLIPTLIAHKYYCNTQAGFWIYKTPKEWEEENPEVASNLKMSLSPSYVNESDINGGVDRTGVTQRFYHEVKREEIFLSLGKTEKTFVDLKTEEVIAKSIDFVLGSNKASVVSGGSLQSWRRAFVFSFSGKGQCAEANGVSSIEKDFDQFIYQFWRQGENK